MKRIIFVFWIIGATIIYFGCSEHNPSAPELIESNQIDATLAKKPAPKLIGEIYCKFTGIHPYYWVGTVDFGEYGVYGMKYESLSRRDVGNVFHFTENFFIYDLEHPHNIYIAGSDFGVGNRTKGIMNGFVEEANPPFEEWLGRNVHMEGTAIMGPDGPIGFEGTIRIN